MLRLHVNVFISDSSAHHNSSGIVKYRLLTFPEMCQPFRHPGSRQVILLEHCRQQVIDFITGNFLSNGKLYDTALSCFISTCSIVIMNSNKNNPVLESVLLWLDVGYMQHGM
jgi:hypothetical protein